MLVHRNFEIRRAKEFECMCAAAVYIFILGWHFFHSTTIFHVFFVIDTASHFDIAQCVRLCMTAILSERFSNFSVISIYIYEDYSTQIECQQ